MPRSLRALVVAVVATLLVAAPAHAHTSLIDVSPADGARVDIGQEVTLTFSDPLLTIGAEAIFTDAAGAATALEVDQSVPEAVTVELPADAAVGAGELGWRVVAEDGHPITGTLAYEVAAAASEVASPSPSPAPDGAPSPSGTPEPVAGDASEAPSASASADDATGDAEGGAVPGWAWWGVGVLAGLAAIAVAAVRLRGARGSVTR